MDLRMLRTLRSVGRSSTPALAHPVELPEARVRAPPTGLSKPSDWIDMTMASVVNILKSDIGSSDLDKTEAYGVRPIRAFSSSHPSSRSAGCQPPPTTRRRPDQHGQGAPLLVSVSASTRKN